MKLLFVLLTLLCSMALNAQTWTDPENGIMYEIDGENAKVCYGKNCIGNIEIKSLVEIDGKTYDVTSIGEEAFYFCYGLTSIIIPEGVTTIGDAAFYYCNRLTKVTIPESITSIGMYAFYYCSYLSKVTIPGSVITIEASAFADCLGLTEVTIYEGVTSIGDGAFHNCSRLISVTIPESVNTIGDEAFGNCKNLASVIMSSKDPIQYEKRSWNGLPEGNDKPNLIVPKGSKETYETKGWAENFIITEEGGITTWTDPENGITYEIDGENAKVTYGRRCLGSVEIKSQVDIDGKTYDVTGIGHGAFFNCTNLLSIKIREGVEYIGDSAFCNCSNLSEIEMPSSINNTGWHAFSNCSSLKAILMNSDKPIPYQSSSWEGTPSNDSKTYVYVNSGTKEAYEAEGWAEQFIIHEWGYIAPKWTDPDNGITYEIEGNNAKVSNGRNCTGNVVIKSQVEIEGKTYDVTSIETSAFYNCTNMTSIIIPDGITSIGQSAFHGCTKLTCITIPDGVTCIGQSAFQGCTKLTCITIPISMTTIGKYAFFGCINLTSVTFSESVTDIGFYAFGCCSIKTVIMPSKKPKQFNNEPWDIISGDKPNLIVPQDCKDAYEAKGWAEGFNIIEDSEDTGIDMVGYNKANSKAINLMGVPVDRNHNGIIIMNGKKILKRN